MKQLFHDGARFLGYTALLIALVMSAPALVQSLGVSFFVEDGPVELAQLGLLLLNIMLLLVGYARCAPWRAAFSLLLLFFVWCFVRENDALFDRLLPYGGWQLVSIVGMALCVWLAYRARDTLKPGILGLARGRGMALIWAGAMLFGPLAQALGHKPLLILVFPGDYSMAGKQVVEELLEFFGFLLALMGVVEALIEARRQVGIQARERARVAAPAHPGWRTPHIVH